ncbi:acyl carrier protein [Nocardiopsis terrae]
MTAFTQERIQSELFEIINEVTGIPLEEIEPDKLITDDLDIDSLSLVEIMVSAEEHFGATLPEEEMVEFKTIKDVVAFISARSS